MLVTNRPLPGGRLSSLQPPSRSTRRKAPALVIALVSAFALAAVPAFADPTVASKQAEAQSVLGQIQQLDSSLERAIEAYDLANVKLTRIKHDLSTNTQSLAVAKKSLKHAQKAALVAARRPLHLGGPGLGAGGAPRLGEPGRHAEPDGRGRPRLAAGLARRAPGGAPAARGAGPAAAPAARRAASRCRSWPNGRPLGLRSRASSDSAVRCSAPFAARSPTCRQQERQQQAALQRQLQSQLQAQQATASQSILSQTVGAQPSHHGRAARRPPRYGGVVGIAMQYLGTPYVWGGASPERLRLLGVRDVRLQPDRRLAAAQLVRAVRLREPGLARRPAARRPRLLRRARPRRHLRRRRQLHPRAAHRRRGQDLFAHRLVRVDVRRRTHGSS